MKKIIPFLIILAVAACTPTFDINTYSALGWINVNANDMRNHCSTITTEDVHNKLLLTAQLAEQQELDRKYADDLNKALAALVKSIKSMESVYKKGTPSEWYCKNQLGLIIKETTRIKRGIAELEDVRNPILP